MLLLTAQQVLEYAEALRTPLLRLGVAPLPLPQAQPGGLGLPLLLPQALPGGLAPLTLSLTLALAQRQLAQARAQPAAWLLPPPLTQAQLAALLLPPPLPQPQAGGLALPPLTPQVQVSDGEVSDGEVSDGEVKPRSKRRRIVKAMADGRATSLAAHDAVNAHAANPNAAPPPTDKQRAIVEAMADGRNTTLATLDAVKARAANPNAAPPPTDEQRAIVQAMSDGIETKKRNINARTAADAGAVLEELEELSWPVLSHMSCQRWSPELEERLELVCARLAAKGRDVTGARSARTVWAILSRQVKGLELSQVISKMSNRPRARAVV